MITKRIFDLVLALPGMALLLPVFVIIGFWVKFDSRGPIFFRQDRVGKFGKIFRIYKFRTMCFGAETKGKQLTVGDDIRITRAGHFLRKYKLDELPQLLNVIKGEMSLVGPRPEVPYYVKFYPEDVREQILSVPPGITDYASIEFRDENSYLNHSADPEKVYIEEVIPQKISYYQRYIQERSLLVDIKVILKTLKALIR